MLYIVLILIMLICILLVLYPFIIQPKQNSSLFKGMNLQSRKANLISQLNSELASGALSKDLYNQLKKEVNEMIDKELINLDENENRSDPIERIIQLKKDENS